MLDTLKLSLSDYEIDPAADLTVQPASFNPSTKELGGYYPLWRDGRTHVVGTKAFHNSENFNVTVQPFNPKEPQSIGCFVQFSVPKLASDSNYEPADFATTKTAMQVVEAELRCIGVRTNIETAHLSRVDSCKNAKMQEPYQAYHPIFSMLTGTRVAKRDYGTTFLWHNTVQEVCVYDKIEEMKRRKRNVTGLPVNTVRLEHRLLKARKVRETLGFNNVAGLLEGFEQIEIAYKAAMKNQLFKHTPEEIGVMTANQIAEQLKRLKESSDDGSKSRYYLQDWLTAFAINQLGGDADNVIAALEQISDSRATKARMKKKLQEARINALEMQESMCSKRTLGALYRELESQVVSAS